MGRTSPTKSGGVPVCDRYHERALRVLQEMERRLMTQIRTMMRIERVFQGIGGGYNDGLMQLWRGRGFLGVLVAR